MLAVALQVGAGQGEAHPWASATFPHPPTGFPRGFPDRCGQFWIACGPVRGSLMRVETSSRLYRFAGALEGLLAAPDAEAFERAWEMAHVDRLAWEALGGARRADSEALEPALDQVDRRLLATLERCRAFADPHVVTFRVPELERWQHAAAAALVGARRGTARASLLRVPRAGRTAPRGGMAAVRAVSRDAGRAPRVCRRRRGSGALLRGTRRRPRALVRADPRRPAAAAVPGPQDPRVPLCAG